MIDKTVILTALARDCDNNLVGNLERIERLRREFCESYVVILENDSKDRTKEILAQYEINHSGVKILSHDYNGIYPIPSYPPSTIPWMSCQRIARMAFFRNQVLSYSLENYVFDYYITIDIDVLSFDVSGILDSITHAPNDWGCIFANGCYEYQSFSGKKSLPYQYDSYAFVKESEDPMSFDISVLDENVKLSRAKYVSDCLKNNPFYPCKSAFGGVGIYKRECLTNLEYKVICPSGWEEYNACLCEHVSLNSEISSKGARCYVSDSLHVCYGEVGFKGLKGLFFRLFPYYFVQFSYIIKKIVR